MLSDEWLPRYRLLENFTAKWNGNAYDRGDYNSSFALRAVELKSPVFYKHMLNSHRLNDQASCDAGILITNMLTTCKCTKEVLMKLNWLVK